MDNRIKMKWIIEGKNEWYESECGLTLKREYGPFFPSGKDINGQWVLRDSMDIVLDWGSMREDIGDKNNLELFGPP